MKQRQKCMQPWKGSARNCKLREPAEKIVRESISICVRHSENASAGDLATTIVDDPLAKKTMCWNRLASSFVVTQRTGGSPKISIWNSIKPISCICRLSHSSQRKALVDKFGKASRTLRQGGIKARCIEGCCYGPSRHVHRDHHEILVGDVYWYEISNWSIARQYSPSSVNMRITVCSPLVEMRAPRVFQRA